MLHSEQQFHPVFLTMVFGDPLTQRLIRLQIGVNLLLFYRVQIIGIVYLWRNITYVLNNTLNQSSFQFFRIEILDSYPVRLLRYYLNYPSSKY